jgi:hypothetical protein
VIGAMAFCLEKTRWRDGNMVFFAANVEKRFYEIQDKELKNVNSGSTEGLSY